MLAAAAAVAVVAAYEPVLAYEPVHVSRVPANRRRHVLTQLLHFQATLFLHLCLNSFTDLLNLVLVQRLPGATPMGRIAMRRCMLHHVLDL